MRFEPGQRVGVYEIVGSIGTGGMGEVYRARDTRLGRPVAIKFVSDEMAADRTASERLEREARLTSLLNHPNIVTVHDVGEIDGRPFIVMEFVEGQSLHAAMQWERLTPSRVIEIASQVADGLAVAHDAGIVHRDLKPRNIMMTADGRAKIVDFGLGKTNRPAPASGAEDPTVQAAGLTDRFAVVGTAGYMAPEQVVSKPTDFRADQFALGAMIYEMLTGRRAFKRDTAVQTMAAIVDSEPDPLARLCPDAPFELVTIVERCLAKDPAHRYASSQDLARDLRDLRAFAGSRSSRSAISIRQVTRGRWRPVVVILAVIALAAVVAFLVMQGPASDLAQARALLDRFDKQANVDQAISLLTTAVTARPRDPAARTMLAEAYLRKFEYVPKDTKLADRAGEEAGVVLTLEQTYAPVHVVLALINYSQGRFEGAFGEAEKAIAIDPRHSRAWRERGRAQMRLGRRDDAERDFLRAVEFDPDDWATRNNLGALYLTGKRLDDAVREFERVIQLAPDNTRGYNNLGSTFAEQERFDKTAEMYERSLSLDKNATAYSNLGTALYQQGRYGDAARSFEGAVALPGATFLHWFNLGAACYWALDQRSRAKEAYEMAVKLGEDDRLKTSIDMSRLAQLASSYAVLSLLTAGAEAESYRSRARKLIAFVEQQQPHDAGVLSTIATVHEELGDRAKALTWLEQAIKAGYAVNRIERSPWLKELRGDPRYGQLRK